jgi:sortase A
VIPAIDVDAQVVSIPWETYIDHKDRLVTGWHVPGHKAGWHNTSAWPGHRDNCVISAHNNFRGEIFRYLYKVEPGDEVFLYVEDRIYCYLVTDAFRLPENDQPNDVREENARWIAPTSEERLTLVSCWPYMTPTHRVIVLGRAIPCGWATADSAESTPER